MKSFLMRQNADCWGALDFLDEHMRPTERTVVIESYGVGSPPGGGDPKTFFRFKGDTRKCFFKNTALVFMANRLRSQNPDEVIGAGLRVTVIMDKSPKGKGKVWSMQITAAAYPKNHARYNRGEESETEDTESERAAIKGENT